MKIAMVDGEIFLREMTPAQYSIIKGFNLMKWNKAQQYLQGCASAELLDKLTCLGKLPPDIEAYRQSLHKTADLVNAERIQENPEPIIKPPVKVSLFKHQVRALNMAILTFGWADKGGEQSE